MVDERTEWLEADGLGGFASGTTSGVRTRRYHALLLTATTPPTGRLVLVNGFDAFVETATGTHALTTQRYAPGVLHPDGASRIASFAATPWPTWEYALPDGTRVTQEILVEHGTGRTLVVWTLKGATGPVTLRVRPFLSGRDYHATHHENGAFHFDAVRQGPAVVFRPYPGVPDVVSSSNGEYRHAPEWYRQFLYAIEHERGLDAVEDLASPGELSWTLSAERPRAVWLLASDGADSTSECFDGPAAVEKGAEQLRVSERRRRSRFASARERAGDAYLVRRGNGRTIVAGYPWFTDWGRDTFIALRGLCLATGRLGDARDILLEWASTVSEGMLPNRFPDGGDQPEFNSVDASLWYVIAVHELLSRAGNGGGRGLLTFAQWRTLETAMEEIVGGYAAGTRYGIRMDADGLLAAGVRGQQLTWMDARVGDREITPRIGKPVEVQALWINALHAVAARAPSWTAVIERARRAFLERFWIEDGGYLADVVDVDHVAGTRDDTVRPNQVLAVGGLPYPLLDGDRARRVIDLVTERLLTPAGLRSLAPGEPGYVARYEGDGVARDAAYHQGTVWPWLLGPFVEGWVRVRGNTPAARQQARRQFLDPLLTCLDPAGVGHLPEIADAEAPWTPRGCPFQAWSLGECLRLDRSVLAVEQQPRDTNTPGAPAPVEAPAPAA